jgi:hypothetical protein
MPPTFQRPAQGFRFSFGGMKLNSNPDTLPLDKYAAAVNIRALLDSSIRTRPGQTQKFATGGHTITDLSSYSILSTDDAPRYIARDILDSIWLDNGVVVGALVGGGASPGASMIPFRPGQSPSPYLYIANGSDYQKFSAPTGANIVSQSKVGIAEPQFAPNAAPSAMRQASLASLSWAQGGTAGAPSSTNRISDTAGTVLPDPDNAALLSVQVGTSQAYQRWMSIAAAAGGGTAGSQGPLTASFSVDSGGSATPWTGTGAGGGSANLPQFGFSNGLKITNFGFSTIPVGATITGIKAEVLRHASSNVALISDLSVLIIKNGVLTGNDHSLGGYWPAVDTYAVYGGPGDTWHTFWTYADIQSPGFGVSIGAENNASRGSATATVTSVRMTVYYLSGGVANTAVVIRDVFPALPTAFAIASIYYFSGTTGHCVLVPTTLATGPGTGGQSLYADNVLSTLRRGALIKIASEICIVWSVSVGPDGTVSIETSTNSVHTTSDTLTSLPTIQTLGQIFAAQTLSEVCISYQVTVGIGTQTATITNPFVTGGNPFRPDDLISFGIQVDDLTKLTELKILFDVGDGSFTHNFYYYTVRPSDIAAAVANSATQLAAAQTIDQRATIDEETIAASGNQLHSASSAMTVAGVAQWTQIVFSIGELTRVGGDQTKSLQNVSKVQFLWNASGTINVFHDGAINILGGYDTDTGDIGAPYLYRVRPRSSATGARGNPSPATRYGISPRREQVTVYLPSPAYDSQIDTWDIFRYGGSVTSFRYIGSTPSSNATFIDNYSDDAAGAGDVLDFDNFEPWPSVDLPFSATATSVVGTVALVTVPSPTNILGYLPGNLVQLSGTNVYTLRNRPVLISGTTYRLEFEENAGTQASVTAAIYEPELANQHLPYMFGPDVSGTVFACGDPLRPGTLYFAKNYAPDSAPDGYNVEITPPSEPLLGGEVLDGLAFVGSPERWWALYPQPDNPSQRYNFVQQPFPRGLAAPYGHCNDGVSMYWWAKDGIQSSTKGSLTDADLYNLFPHDGVPGKAVTYAGLTFTAPDYSRAGTFRLTYSNYYLYATYQDSAGTYRQLVLDTRRMAWCIDSYTPAVSAFLHPAQPAGSLLTNTTRYDELLMGTVTGLIAMQTDNTNDLGGPISCALDTAEFDGGDSRAPKQWGDIFLDVTPGAFAGVYVFPVSFGVAVAPTINVPASASRQRLPLGVGGVVVSDFMGLVFIWTDDFTQQSVPTQLHIWHPSFVVQPAYTQNWFTFGTTFGMDGFKHVPRIILAWVSTAPITLTVTSFDGQSPAAITIPSSGGAYKKQLFMQSANKGLLYKFSATSTAKFQIFLDDSEVHVGSWARSGPYSIFHNLGGQDSGPI